MAQVAAILNLTPLGVSIRNAASPALNVITPNQFQTFHNTKRNLIGSVTIGGILDGLQGHADAMLNLYSNVVLPSILPPTRWANHKEVEKLQAGDTVLFARKGEESSLPG